MSPIEEFSAFAAASGYRVVLGENQPEYQPLPCWRWALDNGAHTSCWRLSFWERLQVFLTGRLWITQLTFGHQLQPVLPTVHPPSVDEITT